MLQNAYLVAKIGADTAENAQHFAGIWPKTVNYPTTLRSSRREVQALATGDADERGLARSLQLLAGSWARELA